MQHYVKKIEAQAKNGFLIKKTWTQKIPPNDALKRAF